MKINSLLIVTSLAFAFFSLAGCTSVAPVENDKAVQGEDSEAIFNEGVGSAEFFYEKAMASLGPQRYDEEEAIYFLRKAAALDHTESQWRLAGILMNKRGEPDRIGEVVSLLDRAADKGHTDSMLDLALFYRLQIKDIDKYFYYSAMAAYAGDPRGMHYLGHAFHYGHGVNIE